MLKQFKHVNNELRKRFSKNGEYRKKLNALKKLKKKYPESDLINKSIKLFRQKIYGAKGGFFIYDNTPKLFCDLLPSNSNGIFEIEGVKFDLSLPDVRKVFYQELIDLLGSDDYFAKQNSENELYYEVMKAICQEGPYQYESVRLQHKDVVLDVGANIGMFSILSGHFYNCKCYAFEPIKSTVELLEKNIALNGMEQNISVAPYALGDSVCEVEFQITDSIGSSTFARQTSEERIGLERVQCTTLDCWVVENDIQKIDFIKADIEGAERNMLLGATEVLKKFAPKLSICTYHLPDDPQVLESIILNANPNYKIIHAHKKLYAHVLK